MPSRKAKQSGNRNLRGTTRLPERSITTDKVMITATKNENESDLHHESCVLALFFV